MKFEKQENLRKFIIEKQLFSGFSGLKEIYTGGSSYNFRVKAGICREKESEFLLKLLRDFEAWQKLSKILSVLEKKHDLPVDKFENYYLLAMPYIDGRKLKYSDCSPDLFKALLQKYDDMQYLNKPEIIIGEAHNLNRLLKNISEKLSQKEDIFSQLIKKYFVQKVRNELVCLKTETGVVHGDLTANNIMMDKQGRVHLLDYGSLRFGHPMEDFAGLVLQLSGFRGMFGSLRRFTRLKKMLDNEEKYSLEEWLYGVQAFYLRTLLRHINNTKKWNNYRKKFCLLTSLTSYFRLAKIIRGG